MYLSIDRPQWKILQNENDTNVVRINEYTIRQKLQWKTSSFKFYLLLFFVFLSMYKDDFVPVTYFTGINAKFIGG